MIYQKPKPSKKKALGTKKVSLSLPPSVVSDLDTISSSMGLSRSAFLSSLLSQILPPMSSTIATLIANSSDLMDAHGDVLDSMPQQRYNAHSKVSIDEYIKNLTNGGQHDLFNGK
jgi:hypothetical protein